jgi:lipopolysaccharide biosynthesis regulator YciM
MFPSDQLFVVLLVLFLMLLGLWGGKSFLAWRSGRKRSQQYDSDPVLPVAKTEKSAADESKLLRTYFRGLSYVIANETDKAVAEFVKVAQVNSTTAEIYLALGQLFRNSGEVERAIRVHRDILLRPNLPDDVRHQTFFEIGLDYKKAGLFDRACHAFEEIVENDPQNQAACKELSSLYVSLHEWEKALTIHQNFPASQSETSVIAHLTTEVAQTAARTGDKKKAAALFKKAIELDNLCVDAWLHYGDFLLQENQQPEALAAWEKAFLINPEFTPQVIKRLRQLPETEQDSILENFFLRHLDKFADNRKFNLAYIDWLIKSNHLEKAKSRLQDILNKTDGDSETFLLAKQLFAANQLLSTSDREIIDNLISEIFAAEFRFEKSYHCQKCGYKLESMVWRCPRCSSWDSVTVR